jgi:hypothetical protein
MDSKYQEGHPFWLKPKLKANKVEGSSPISAGFCVANLKQTIFQARLSPESLLYKLITKYHY